MNRPVSGETTRAELLSQPDAWARLLGRLEAGALVSPVDLGAFEEVLLLGSGSSYYLALSLADWLRRRGRAARAVPSCEVLLDPWETRPSGARRLAVGLSRSGRSTELMLAVERLRGAGFATLGLSCTADGPLLAAADHALLVGEGREDGLVMLRSFTAMLIAGQWLWGGAEDRAALARLPEAGRAALAAEAAVGRLAEARAFERFVFLGSASAHPLAREAALKMQEMAIATSEAYHSLDYRHGPKACAGRDTLAVLFPVADPRHGLALARDVRALGAAVMVAGPGAEPYEGAADLALPMPGPAEHAAAAMLLPAQLLALATALRRGRDPDAPVNLQKVVMF